MIKPSRSLLICLFSSLAATAAPLDDGGLRELGLVKYWEANIPIGAEDRLETAHLVDGTLYVVSAKGKVFSLVAEVGLIRWGSALTAEDYVIRRPSHLINGNGTGPVAIRTTDRLYVIDRYNGSILHSSKPEFPFGSSFVGAENLLFAGSADGMFYATRWAQGARDRLSRVWHVKANGPVTAAPVLFGGDKVLFASQGGTVYSCVAFDKTLAWSFQAGGAVLANPVASVNGVYVASMDQSIYKLDAQTGRVIWRYRTPSVLTASPSVAGDTLYQFGEGLGLVALDTQTGRPLWISGDSVALAARLANHDIVWTSSGSLRSIDHKTGKILADVRVRGAVGAVVNVQHDSLYVLGADGTVLCGRPLGAPHLRPQEVDLARRTMNRAPTGKKKADKTDAQDTSTRRDSDPFRSSRDR